MQQSAVAKKGRATSAVTAEARLVDFIGTRFQKAAGFAEPPPDAITLLGNHMHGKHFWLRIHKVARPLRDREGGVFR